MLNIDFKIAEERNSMFTVIVTSFFFLSFFIFNLISPGLILAALTFIVLEIRKEKKLSRHNKGVNALVFFYFISICISTLLSQDSEQSYIMLQQFVPAFIIYLLISDYLLPKHADFFFYVFLIIAIVVSIKLLFIFSQHSLAYPPREMMKESQLPFYTGNDTVFLVLLAPLFIYLLTRIKNMTTRVLAVLAIILPFGVSIIYQSRLSLLIYLVLLFAYMLFTRNRYFLTVLFLGGGLFVLFDSINGFTLFEKFSDLSTFDNRLMLWVAALKIFLANPWFGSGPDTYYLLYLDQIRVYGDVTHLEGIPWPHGLLVEILAEQGIVGFVLLSAICVKVFHALYQSIKEPMQEHFAWLIKVNLLIIFIGFFVSLLLELTFHRMWVPVFLFFLLAIMQRSSIISNENK
jgi:O-antigen ligase